MKEVVFILIGSILTQSAQQISKDINLKEKIEQRKEIRYQKKQQRIHKRVLRLQSKLQKKDSLI